MASKPIRLVVYFLGAFTLLAFAVTVTQAKYTSVLGGASANQLTETPTIMPIITLVPSFTPTFTSTPEAPATPEATQNPQSTPSKNEEVHFSGVITAINGDQWTIDGKTVTVGGKTEIEGKPMVGDTVEVEAILQADGTYLARDISNETEGEHQPSVTPGSHHGDDENENEDEHHASVTGTPNHNGDDDGEESHFSQSTPLPGSNHEGNGGHHHGGDDGGGGGD